MLPHSCAWQQDATGQRCPHPTPPHPTPAGAGEGSTLALAQCPLLTAVPVRNLHLCEGYTGPDGRYHPGFYCPRLTDPPGHRYCCRPGPRALKSCCTQLGLEALAGVNLSGLVGPGLLR